MLRHRTITLAVCALVGLDACAARKPGSPLTPGFNLFSKQQDVQLGQQAAAQVRQQYEVVHNPQLQNYINTIGQKLAATPPAAKSGFHFTFTLLNSKEVNAFALPGGPMFIFTGLLKSVDNEGELAGVMAHEMSHVILRHGTNQASKANLLQIPEAIAGAALGQGAASQIIQAGLGLGLNGLFLKFSRTDESQADAMGTHIMADAGYNPIEMADFFEKLQKQGGPGVPQFLSDHPSTGNRIKAVEAEIRTMPPHQYNANTGEFPQMKQLVAQLPPPTKQPQQQAAVAAPPQTDGTAGGYQTINAPHFTIAYPAGWKAYSSQGSSAVTIAPQQGLVQGQNGNVSIGYGATISYFFPQNSRENVKQATSDLIHHLHAQNPSLQETGRQRSVRVDGSKGIETTFTSDSPYGGAEIDRLLTVSRPEGLFYVVLAAPQQYATQAGQIMDQMVSTLRFR